MFDHVPTTMFLDLRSPDPNVFQNSYAILILKYAKFLAIAAILYLFFSVCRLINCDRKFSALVTILFFSYLQNSIRHNLSLYDMFVRVRSSRGDRANASYWTLCHGSDADVASTRHTSRSSSSQSGNVFNALYVWSCIYYSCRNWELSDIVQHSVKEVYILWARGLHDQHCSVLPQLQLSQTNITWVLLSKVDVHKIDCK